MKTTISSIIEKILSGITSTSHSRDSELQCETIECSKAIDILSDERRRYALRYLANKPLGEPIPMRELAEYIASQENDCPVEELSYQERNRVYIALLQSHCKSLTKVVKYDSNRKTITPTEEVVAMWEAYWVFQKSLQR